MNFQKKIFWYLFKSQNMLIIRKISEDDLWYLKDTWQLLNWSKSSFEVVFLGPTSIFGKFFTDFWKMMIACFREVFYYIWTICLVILVVNSINLRGKLDRHKFSNVKKAKMDLFYWKLEIKIYVILCQLQLLCGCFFKFLGVFSPFTFFP